MSQKIDAPSTFPENQSDFSKGFIWKISITTIIVLIILALASHSFQQSKNNGRQFLPAGSLTFPWIIGAGVTIQNGLNRFSYESGGDEMRPLSEEVRIWTLLSVLVLYVIAPTFFFFGWRKYRIRPVPAREPLIMFHVFYLISCIPLLALSISIVPVALIHYRVQSNLREVNAVQENKDLIINELNFIKNNAREYYLLPKQFGGGDGSFTGYQIHADISSTPQSTYSCQTYNDFLYVEAHSAKYPGAVARVKISSDGLFHDWEYEGKFL
ncbi:MAG: hypothetical protein V1799_15520 [bacterium]